MHQTLSPYRIEASCNHHFSAETFLPMVCDTIFWPIGSCILLSPIQMHPRIGVRPSLPKVILPCLLNLVTIIRNTQVLLIKFSFRYFGRQRACWLNHPFYLIQDPKFHEFRLVHIFPSVI
jgi:hypothetical protein